MGMLESSVVIYLRELYYPDGFHFPLKETSYTVAVTEIFRELSTLIMLLGIGVLAGKSKHERFAWFIYSFAIWDIFYYVFLFLIINWPVSLIDWDVLFLLPMMWVGPVWSPVLLSLLMILLAQCILYFSKLRNDGNPKLHEWILLITGALIVIIAFCKDFYLYMTSHYPMIPRTQLFFSKRTFEFAAQYVPSSFEVLLFLFGCGIICTGIGMYVIRNKRDITKSKLQF
ncbi:MAG: hypothetical protein GZ094_19575 [Mariniphaga sp.]|nr:hypothetical protein [Mariniphaga sp.]